MKTSAGTAKRLILTDLCKAYGEKTVLKDLSCHFPAGSLFALLGENGAGKSTLASVICGEKYADSGTISFDGIATCALVHQRPLLADSLNVQDNIILGTEPVYALNFFGIKRKIGFIDFSSAHEKTAALLRAWDIDLDTTAPASSLSAAERFYAAFAAALYKNPDVLILDEPGAVLNDKQKRSLYPALKNFARAGKIVILITHDMQDALEYADTLIILRPAKNAVCANTNDPACTAKYIHRILFGEAKLIHNTNIVQSTRSGRNIHNVCTEPVLSVEQVSCSPLEGAALHDISFKVFPHAITCIYGHRENGLETLENLITGMNDLDYTGRIVMDGKTVKPTPFLLRSAGCGIVPFNRTFRGSNPSLSVEQMVCVHLKSKDKIKNSCYTRSLIDRSGVVIDGSEATAALSGGMLQRLIIERETDGNKRLLILSEPERGLDNRAAKALMDRLTALAEKGAAVLLFLVSAHNLSFDGTYRYFMQKGRLYEN